MLLLGLETSCDDTAAAVVRDGRTVLSNVCTNQDAFHAKYGGIVPEIAGRRHLALLSAAAEDALGRAHLTLGELDGIAVTAGPGLIGSLVVGVACAKALAFASGKPLYAVNHLHGHIFSAYLNQEAEPRYPLLVLLVSGGHSQLAEVQSPTMLRIIGKTLDDAAGEAFDKTARLLGLPFPGGPQIDRLAATGKADAHAFPRHQPEAGTLNLSFSGLKTSVRYFLESRAGRGAIRADVAASFQAAVVDVLIDRLKRALNRRAYQTIVLSGGVAANSALQRAFIAIGNSMGSQRLIPPPSFCTDNAAMIAAAADTPRRSDTRRSAHAYRRSEPSVRIPAARERSTVSDLFINIACAALGTLVVLAVFVDVFGTAILPRPMRTLRVSRLLWAAMWRVWRARARALADEDFREKLFGIYAPFTMLAIVFFWLVFSIIGFGLITYALRVGVRPEPHTLGEAMYAIGVTVLTIGYGDYVPVSPLMRVIALFAAAAGRGSLR